ncbi:MAG: diheme cytochrome c [gamma proteobacterium symbiont of Bathyaustriella thionipta]|nr:diheme cytochrome c [gamma proteobacterium symbiont of Bathyaustriella thionipta]MCU7950281.1 diheme cytochrome c [gamma proteobacterium symbiont of Bathyaustriella thionipta]MCU7951812.1 diheme cytochrome c [gamma proteobacterium symbiont of Bathyaustriella thionipta]MCU7957548.1 diheme cytochrome c [gamma proteobacterium symbiont of Bathyaustriella thionipta]MCU7966989.1 diheme cytochrome c [gamma proteobacterium symbiont of Bathyaustriella thionipta]
MKQISSAASLLLLSIIMLGMSNASFSDDDKHGFFSRILSSGKTPGVAPITNPQYLEECGSCHFPYQPGLLPARSWRRVMADLEDHFGESSELPPEDATKLTDYLVKNAADYANYKRSKKIMRSLHPHQTPKRVSETPYFIKEHHELSRKMVQNNPKVGLISKCQACHTRAEEGSFSEREILIPGFGGWDD